MHLGVSQKIFCLYCVCIVYAVAMTSHENRNFPLQTFLYFLKIHHKIFNSVQLFLKFLFTQAFEGDEWKYKDIVGKNVNFFLKHLQYP